MLEKRSATLNRMRQTPRPKSKPLLLLVAAGQYLLILACLAWLPHSPLAIPALVAGLVYPILAALGWSVLGARGSLAKVAILAGVPALFALTAGSLLAGLISGQDLLINGVIFFVCWLFLILMPLLEYAQVRAQRPSSRLLLVADEEEEEALNLYLAREHTSYRIAEVIRPDREELLAPLAHGYGAGNLEIVISRTGVANQEMFGQVLGLRWYGFRTRTLANFYEEEMHRIVLSEFDPIWLLDPISERDSRFYPLVKRLAETAFSAILLILSVPLWPIIFLGIKLSSPGPVFFRQERVGLDGKLFTLLKFRTMYIAEESDNRWAGGDVQRVFPFGRFLRRNHLDEIPQLLGVIRGQMSLIGPRPEQPGITDEIASKIPAFRVRSLVRPGVTGWAQVSHGYGGSWEGSKVKLEYDLYYIRHQSLRLDSQIILATIRRVLHGQDVYQDYPFSDDSLDRSDRESLPSVKE